ncbi:hypothetical protein GCM10018791_70330 [Streptomyces zaomyceticus]|nr:hypothetical protein GCM10018791_70330 [Streptomyces zaomyceticus]
MLAGAISGAVAGSTYYPATFDTDLRLAAASAVAFGPAHRPRSHRASPCGTLPHRRPRRPHPSADRGTPGTWAR